MRGGRADSELPTRNRLMKNQRDAQAALLPPRQREAAVVVGPRPLAHAARVSVARRAWWESHVR